MSAFSGRQSKGAMKRHRDVRKTQAADRNARSEHLPLGRKFRQGEVDYAIYTVYGRRPLR